MLPDFVKFCKKVLVDCATFGQILTNFPRFYPNFAGAVPFGGAELLQIDQLVHGAGRGEIKARNCAGCEERGGNASRSV